MKQLSINNVDTKDTETFVFKHPFRCYIAGPSNCGKTTLIQQILLNQHKLINRPQNKTMQSAYEVFKYLTNDVEFCECLIDIKKFDATKYYLLIIDDLMELCKDSNEILNLFTVDSHHRNISVFFVYKIFTQKANLQGILI
jgi:GTPase SAR1 family protein